MLVLRERCFVFLPPKQHVGLILETLQTKLGTPFALDNVS